MFTLGFKNSPRYHILCVPSQVAGLARSGAACNDLYYVPHAKCSILLPTNKISSYHVHQHAAQETISGVFNNNGELHAIT